MVVLRPEIPVPMDSIKVQLSPGTISAETRMTFANATGNVLYDLLISGSHTLLLKGALSGTGGMGKFNLQDTLVWMGCCCPRALVDLLIKKYAKPKYLDVDLNKPFKLPYGINAIAIENGKASIESTDDFKLVSTYSPRGDQVTAIEQLDAGLSSVRSTRSCWE